MFDGETTLAPMSPAAEAILDPRISQVSRRNGTEAPRVRVRDTPQRLRALELGADDLREAAVIEQLELDEGDEFAVEVELGEEAA